MNKIKISCPICKEIIETDPLSSTRVEICSSCSNAVFIGAIFIAATSQENLYKVVNGGLKESTYKTPIHPAKEIK